MTIDIWLFAAACFYFLVFCAILRVIPGPTLNDRLIALNVATTLACAGSVTLTVSLGNLLILPVTAVIACIVFGSTIRISQTRRELVP